MSARPAGNACLIDGTAQRWLHLYKKYITLITRHILSAILVAVDFDSEVLQMSTDSKSKRATSNHLNASRSSTKSASAAVPTASAAVSTQVTQKDDTSLASESPDLASSKFHDHVRSLEIAADSDNETYEISSEMKLSRELLMITRQRDQLLRALESERALNKSSLASTGRVRSPPKRKDSKDYVMEKFHGIGRPKPEDVRAASPFRSHGKMYNSGSHLLPVGYEDWKSRVPSLSQVAVEDAIRGQSHLITLLIDELEDLKRSSKVTIDQYSSKADKLARANSELIARVRKLENENTSLNSKLDIENEEIHNLSQYFSVKLSETVSKSKTAKGLSSPIVLPKEMASSPVLSSLDLSTKKNPATDVIPEPDAASAVRSKVASRGASRAEAPKSPIVTLSNDGDLNGSFTTPSSLNEAPDADSRNVTEEHIDGEHPFLDETLQEESSNLLSENYENDVTFEDDPEILEKYNSEKVGFEVAEWGILLSALADYDISLVRSSDRNPIKPNQNSVFRCVLAGTLSRDQFMSVMNQGLSAMSTKARLRFLAEFFSEIRSAATVMKFQQTLLDLPGDEMDLVSLCQLLIGQAVALANAAGGRILLRQEDQFVLIADNLDESVARQQEAKVVEKAARPNETDDAGFSSIEVVSTGFPNGPGSSFSGSNVFAKSGTVMETYYAGPVLPFEGIAAEVCRSGKPICLLEPARSPFFSRSVDLQYPYKSVAIIAAPLFDDKHENVVGVIILYAEPLFPFRKGEDGLPVESPDKIRRKTNFTREDEILSAAFASEAGKEFKQCTQYADSWRMQQLCQKFSTYSPMLETKEEMGSIFSAFSSQLQMLTESEDVCLFLINEDGESAWKLFASSNQDPEPNVSVTSGLLGKTIHRAQLCVVPDSNHPYYKMIDPAVDLCPGKKIQNLSNIISYPMIQGDGSVYGVIQVVNSGMRRVHVEVIATIAAQLEGTLLNSKVPLSLKESFSSQVEHGSQMSTFNPIVASTLTGLVLNELCRLLNIEVARVLLTTVDDENAPFSRSSANGCFCFCSNLQPSLASLDGCVQLPLAGQRADVKLISGRK